MNSRKLSNAISFSLSGTSHWWKKDFILNTLLTINAFKKIGIVNIELMIPEIIKTQEFKPIIRLLEQAKMQITTLHLPKGFHMDNGIIIEKVIQISDMCNCKLIIFHPDNKDNFSDYYKIIRVLKSVNYDVKFLIENIPGVDNFIERSYHLCSNSEYFGVVLDLEHLYRRSENIEEYISLAPYIHNIHFRDYKSEERYVLPGKGVIDYSKIHKFIENYYKGCITVEANLRSIEEVEYCNNYIKKFLGGEHF